MKPFVSVGLITSKNDTIHPFRNVIVKYCTFTPPSVCDVQSCAAWAQSQLRGEWGFTLKCSIASISVKYDIVVNIYEHSWLAHSVDAATAHHQLVCASGLPSRYSPMLSRWGFNAKNSLSDLFKPARDKNVKSYPGSNTAFGFSTSENIWIHMSWRLLHHATIRMLYDHSCNCTEC